MYKERDFSDRRHLVLEGNALEYLLERNRESLMRIHNEIRQRVKESVCKHCNNYNGCRQCAGELK